MVIKIQGPANDYLRHLRDVLHNFQQRRNQSENATHMHLVKIAEKRFLFQFIFCNKKCLTSNYHLRCICVSSMVAYFCREIRDIIFRKLLRKFEVSRKFHVGSKKIS